MNKIVGNPTITPYPRPDWNQTDETKADFIKNKPDLSIDEYLNESSTKPVQNKVLSAAISGIRETLGGCLIGSGRTSETEIVFHSNDTPSKMKLSAVSQKYVDENLDVLKGTAIGSVSWIENAGTQDEKLGFFDCNGSCIDWVDLVSHVYLNSVINEINANFDNINSTIGDIETALDELHAYAQSLINGGGN